MQRRTYLTAVGVAVAATAGCSGNGDDDGTDNTSDDGSSGDSDDNGTNDDTGDDNTGVTGDSSPEEAVRTYINAIDNTDVDQYNGILHPDGPLQELTSDQMDQFQPLTYTIESIEVTEENEDTASARAEYTIEGPEDSQTVTSNIELRPSDGEWKIYTDVLAEDSS